MSVKKKVGVFGGSFDPIHLGHMNLTIELMEQCQLDQVFFCPTASSPFKAQIPSRTPIHHRLAMVRLAISGIASFEVLDWEAKEGVTTYTIETIRRLSQNPSIELHLLMGSDLLTSLDQWKDVEELLLLAPPIVGRREDNLLSSCCNKPYSSHCREVKIPFYDVSSTRIRERLSQKKYCGHLLSPLVLDYILEHRLY